MVRWACVGLPGLLVILGGCVRFHPLHPEWREAKADATAVEAAADDSLRLAAIPAWSELGRSVENRPLRYRRVGRGVRRVIWIGGIHGDEAEGARATEELAAAFARAPGALDSVTLTIVEDINPDGRARGTRGNAHGIDLNRNYPASNFLPGPSFGRRPIDQPESLALHELILAEKPHLVIVAHAWRGDRFINFDGPGAQLAEIFARHSGFPVRPSDKIAPTPGSLGSWVGRTLGTPILTLEYLRGSDPWTDWLTTREAILAVILAA